MSWGVCITFSDCGQCGRSAESVTDRNVTYNNSAIFNRLGVHPDSLKNKTAEDVIPLLEKALSLIPNMRNELEKLEPENGWGGIESSKQFLEHLLSDCRTYPRGKIKVS